MLPKKESARVILAVIALLLIFIMLAVLQPHASTTSSSKNSLGALSYLENPYIYLAGSLSPTADSVKNIDGNLNLRIKPLGTYLLFDESILFCGLPIEKFEGVSEPFVLTYERRAHRIVQGVACHELRSVNHYVEKKELK